jgi:hypothetical protein
MKLIGYVFVSLLSSPSIRRCSPTHRTQWISELKYGPKDSDMWRKKIVYDNKVRSLAA